MKNIRKIIFNIGTALRNKNYNVKLDLLKQSEFYSYQQLREIQAGKLSDILSFAYKNSGFYKSRLDAINYTECEDPFFLLSKLPITLKSDLINFNDEIHTIKNYIFDRLFFSETSGSSGQPLTFYKDEAWDSSNRASIARGMSWHGVDPWERNGYFWGYSFSFIAKIKISIFDWLLNRFRLFSYSDKDIARFMKKAQRATYLHGYSSMIYEVANKLNAAGLTLNNVKFVKGTSEKIYDHYQEAAKKAFGRKIISEYGAAETGIIAFECPDGKMHINEETCVVEIIDDHIVVTNLEAYSFPIIRYALGDYVKLSDQPCSCGRAHRVIEEVLGRVGKNIYGNNDKIFPSLTLYYIFKRLALEHSIQLNYKAEQYSKGELVLKIDRSLTDKVKALIISISDSYFEDSISIIVKDNVIIHDKSKKLKDFESFM
ncbi:phenylacetate--CoA ligase family protein [Aeromonas salmonicida]|uniref:phenylacetate--CoA ligase family protein n=1 Tax=Aeromonas salmonicida TaxID=645 RepID=UPI0013A69F2D|nr:phenylacetate--CoA ligase family protein [Aeromonas salmonicida]